MTKINMDLTELLSKHDQGDFLRVVAEAVLQLIMETDVGGLIGAGRHERGGEPTIWRNGYRERTLDTGLGTLNLRVPKLRSGHQSVRSGDLPDRVPAVIEGPRAGSDQADDQRRPYRSQGRHLPGL